MKRPFLIGITGGSGSGKTHLIGKLMETLGSSVGIFSLDNYYLPYDQQPLDQKGQRNFDKPESLEFDRLIEDLHKVIAGNTIEIPEYNFNYRDEPKKMVTIVPTPIMIIEGLMAIYFKQIRDLLDLKIFVEAPDYLMLKRRIIRDDKERGYNNLTDTLYRFEHHVMPAYRQYISPFKSEVDLIIPNYHHVDRAVDVLLGYIQHRLIEE